MTHSLRSVELFLVRLPLVRPFTTSSHTKSHLDHILIRVRDQAGNEGWGECASASDPYYCSETSETSWHILRDFLVPGALCVSWEHPDQAAHSWRQVRGNNFAKAGLEMACWDLFTRTNGEPLARALGGVRSEIHSGVSLGIEPTPQGIVDLVEGYLAQGYKRIKMKIGPGRDVAFVRAVRERWPDILLMADANSAYSLDNPEHVAALRALDDLQLMMIEQPLADDDIVDHAQLQAQLRTPICLDESIHSAADARKALDLGSCRIINIKVSRLGGLSEAKRVHDLCLAREVPVWCGGMHEFGVGRAANVAICSLPGFTLPGDVSGSDKAYKEDIVDPPIRAREGAIEVPWKRPGLGFDANAARIKAATIRELVLEAERPPVAVHA
jgi:O-succinylbenzoate synthase